MTLRETLIRAVLLGDPGAVVELTEAIMSQESARLRFRMLGGPDPDAPVNTQPGVFRCAECGETTSTSVPSHHRADGAAICEPCACGPFCTTCGRCEPNGLNFGPGGTGGYCDECWDREEPDDK